VILFWDRGWRTDDEWWMMSDGGWRKPIAEASAESSAEFKARARGSAEFNAEARARASVE